MDAFPGRLLPARRQCEAKALSEAFVVVSEGQQRGLLGVSLKRPCGENAYRIHRVDTQTAGSHGWIRAFGDGLPAESVGCTYCSGAF